MSKKKSFSVINKLLLASKQIRCTFELVLALVLLSVFVWVPMPRCVLMEA